MAGQNKKSDSGKKAEKRRGRSRERSRNQSTNQGDCSPGRKRSRNPRRAAGAENLTSSNLSVNDFPGESAAETTVNFNEDGNDYVMAVETGMNSEFLGDDHHDGGNSEDSEVILGANAEVREEGEIEETITEVPQIRNAANGAASTGDLSALQRKEREEIINQAVQQTVVKLQEFITQGGLMGLNENRSANSNKRIVVLNEKKDAEKPKGKETAGGIIGSPSESTIYKPAVMPQIVQARSPRKKCSRLE